MRKLLPIFLLLATCYLLPATSFAQTSACDPCGFCVGGTKPADWEKCMDCLQKEGFTWTVLGCTPTSPGGFVQTILRTVVTMAGGIAFLAFLFGGFTLLTSKGDVEKIMAGKGMVMSSLVGLLLIIFSIFLLRLIGYEILRIPGFGP